MPSEKGVGQLIENTYGRVEVDWFADRQFTVQYG